MVVCRTTPKEGQLWFRGNRDVDEDRPTKHPPGSEEKIREMRRRLLCGLELFNEGDERKVDWDRVNLVGMYSEAIQREAGATGVERDGTLWRARPMAGGVKHNLGEFKTEEAAVAKVQAFWMERLGLPPTATAEEFAAAREADADRSREQARHRKRQEKHAMAMQEVTPLFG